MSAGWRQTGSQTAAYLLITVAHLLNALPENPTDVIVALRRRITDEAVGPAAAADSGSARRVAARSTAVTSVEQNNK